MYPKTGFTKGRVIDFYTEIAPYILPHLKDRPITLKRFPNGIEGEHFYEKDAPSFTPRWIQTFPIPRSSVDRVINYILINDLPTLVWSANMANLEIHPFLAQVPEIDQPTVVVFDLDPGDGATIVNSCEVGFLLKALLDRLELTSLVKVSGSKGIHVHVPLNTKVTYDMTQAFAQSVAQYLAAEHPDLIVAEMAKAKREGKVLIDWSQNAEHKSTVAVYSLRAQAETPYVAMPIHWDELKAARAKNEPSKLFFEPDAALKRLKRVGDLFASALKLKQTLPQPFLDIGSNAAQETNPSAVGSLETYRRKRDFRKTREPAPSLPQRSRQGSRRLFVIQKHAASHLHYDFRLEMGGALKSWALPKGPPFDPNERRLAMATEDHPMDYAKFEGSIPAGEYGGGTVMVWDSGTYELIDGNYWNGKLHIFLNGKKLAGEWVLVKGEDRDGRGNVWYMIKAASGLSRLSDKKENSSALTGRTMQQIADAKDAVWHSDRTKGRTSEQSQTTASVDIDSLPATKIGFIEPMLAAPVSELPQDGVRWTYEIKLDGYRCIALKDEKGVKLHSRKKTLLNSRFPSVVKVLATIEGGTVLDGEIVALEEQGRPSFNLLQNFRLSAKRIYFYAFDLLLYKGKSLINLPLEQRRDVLRQIIAPLPDTIRMSED
ncbi:MAG: non-homologous end-joining DNA ligase, partial [Candidatus Binatia bacterium]